MTRDLTQGKPISQLIAFSIPILLGNLFQQVYNLVDSVIVGQFVNKEALAAVGSTGSLNFLIIGFVLGTSSGLCIPIAQRVGAKDISGVRKRMATAIYIAVAICTVLTVITVLKVEDLLIWMQTPEETFDYALTYIRIIFIGIGVTMVYNLLANILRALGDSKTPLYFLIISSVLNVILDLLFVLVFHMGVAGAAIATVLSQAVSGILCIFYFIKKYPQLRFQQGELKPDFRDIRRSFSIGAPMGFQFSITAIGAVVLQRAVNGLGTDVVASVTASSKVQMIINQPMEALGLSMATFCGQNLGAHRIDRIKEGVRKGTIFVLTTGVVLFLLNITVGQYMSLLFLKKSDYYLLENIRPFMFINGVFFPLLGLLLVLRNALQGFGFSFIAMGAGIFEMVARAFVAFSLIGAFGFTAVCFANPAAWIAADIILVPMYLYGIRKISQTNVSHII